MTGNKQPSLLSFLLQDEPLFLNYRIVSLLLHPTLALLLSL